MAKKRTLMPFYGKAEQRDEADAARALRSGNSEMAKFLFASVERRIERKREAHAEKMAQRSRNNGACYGYPRHV